MSIYLEENNNKDDLFTYIAENINYFPFHTCKHLRILYVIEGSIKITNVSGNVVLSKNQIECINILEPAEIASLTPHNKVLILEIKNRFLYQIDSNINKMILNVGAIQFFPTPERHETKENKINTEKLKKMFLDLFWNDEKDYYSKSTLQNLEGICKLLIECFDDVRKHLFCFSPMNEQIIERFRQIDYYIQENLSERMKLDDLVELVFLSPQYLSSQIKDKYRRTFLNIIEYYRTIEAVRLIIEDHSISTYELIQQCGFSNSKYFYRAFKKHMGRTPKAFREYLIRSGSIAFVKTIDIGSEHLLTHVKQVVNNFHAYGLSEVNLNSEFYELNPKHYSTSQDLNTTKYIHWEKPQSDYYISAVQTLNFLHQYYSVFTSKNPLSIILIQDEVWFYHSGSPLHIELERSRGGERIQAILTDFEKDIRSPVLSLLKGDIVYVQVNEPMNGTLVSRVFNK